MAACTEPLPLFVAGADSTDPVLCPACAEHFRVTPADRRPSCLSCGHALCRACCATFLVTEPRQCPICQCSVLNEVVDNPALAALAETVWHAATKENQDCIDDDVGTVGCSGPRKRSKCDPVSGFNACDSALLEQVKISRLEFERVADSLVLASLNVSSAKERMLQRLESSVTTAVARVEAAKAALDAQLEDCVATARAQFAIRAKALDAQIVCLEVSTYQLRECVRVCDAALASASVSSLTAAHECCLNVGGLLEAATAAVPSTCTYLEVNSLLQNVKDWAAENIWCDDGIQRGHQPDGSEELPNCFLHAGRNSIPVSVFSTTGNRVFVDQMSDVVVVVQQPAHPAIKSLQLQPSSPSRRDCSFAILVDLEDRLVEQHELTVSVFGVRVPLPLASWLSGDVVPAVNIAWRLGPFDMVVSQDGSRIALVNVSLSDCVLNVYSAATGLLVATFDPACGPGEGLPCVDLVRTCFAAKNQLIVAFGTTVIVVSDTGQEVFRHELNASAYTASRLCALNAVDNTVAVAWSTCNRIEILKVGDDDAVVGRVSTVCGFPIGMDGDVTITHVALGPRAQFVAVACHTTSACPYTSIVAVFTAEGEKVATILRYPVTVFGVAWTHADQIVIGCVLLPSGMSDTGKFVPAPSHVCFVDSFSRVKREQDRCGDEQTSESEPFHVTKLPEFEIPLQLPPGCPSFSVCNCEEGVLIGYQRAGEIVVSKLV